MQQSIPNNAAQIAEAPERVDFEQRIQLLFQQAKLLQPDLEKKDSSQIERGDVDLLTDRAGITNTLNLRRQTDKTFADRIKQFNGAGYGTGVFKQHLKDIKPLCANAGWKTETADGDAKSSWAHLSSIAPKDEHEETLQSPEGTSIQVEYKTYFSLDQSGREAANFVKRFVDAVPQIAQAIEQISTAHGNSKITFKFPGDLELMLLHKDSLVIHTNKRELLPVIHERIAQILTAAGVGLERDIRGNNGYDFKCKDPKYSGSYSQLLTAVLGGRMIAMMKKNPSLIEAQDLTNAKRYFNNALETYSKWTPERMIKRLGNLAATDEEIAAES